MNRKARAFEIFEQAFDLPPDEASEFLATECGGDERLRSHVQQLLAQCEEDRDQDEREDHPRPDDTRLVGTEQVEKDGRFLPGDRIGNRYRIVSLIGKGAMGEVYRADDLKLGHPVAIKILPPEFASDPTRLEFFRNEVRLSRQVSHPNVCRVYDMGEFDGLHFLTMEYVDGEDLKTLLSRIGKLPGDKGVEIAQQICAGLAAAHDRNVIHRDLKPANIMIDGQGRARITDFGLAKLVSDTGASEMAGTPIYMAPEQLATGSANIQTDLFALGLVLHELFTGKAVFDATSMADLQKMHDEAARLNRSSSIKYINPLVANAIQSCLENDPARRAKSAREVAASLPGGDAIAAALAMGNAPTPDQVAASVDAGGLSFHAAATSLLTIILGVVAVVATSKSSVINRAGLEKHPQILLDEAKKMVQTFGFKELPVDFEWGFDVDRAAVAIDESSHDKRNSLHHQRRVNFWYRHSPSVLAPISFRDRLRRNLGRVTFGDPPLVSGMARLLCDGSGRLLRFEGMPSDPELDAPAYPWSELVEETLAGAIGAPASAFNEVTPNFVPSVVFQEKRCWTVKSQNGDSFQVQAASWGEQLVYCQVDRAGIKANTSPNSISRRVVLYLLMLAAAAIFSWYNYSVGLGDRLGAMRVSFFVLLGHLSVFTLVGSHSLSPLAEGPLIQQGIALSVFAAVELWLLYMAVEPLVRRVWPHNLISWYRLLAGRFRDPLVGQQIVFGILVGIGLRLTKPIGVYFAGLLGAASPIPLQMTLWPLRGPNFSSARMIADLMLSVQFGLVYLMSFVILKLILRRTSLTLLVYSVMWTAAFAQFAGISAMGVVLLGISMSTKGAMLTRFGLVSVIVILFIERLLEWPITTNTSAWYFPIGLNGIAVVGSIALFATYTAVGGHRRLLARGSLGG